MTGIIKFKNNPVAHGYLCQEIPLQNFHDIKITVTNWGHVCESDLHPFLKFTYTWQLPTRFYVNSHHLLYELVQL